MYTRKQATEDLQAYRPYLGRYSSNYQNFVKDFFVSQDDYVLARLTYHSIEGRLPPHPDLPQDDFMIWARINDDVVPASTVQFD